MKVLFFATRLPNKYKMTEFAYFVKLDKKEIKFKNLKT